jgi:hypothetical protein
MSLPDKDNVAIIAKESSTSYPPSAKLFCNICSCNLILLDPQKEEWYCNRCGISYYPNKGEKVKRGNKLSTPGPETDIHGNIKGEKTPLVAMVDDNTKQVSSISHFGEKKKMPMYFKEMERRGLKITSWEER